MLEELRKLYNLTGAPTDYAEVNHYEIIEFLQYYGLSAYVNKLHCGDKYVCVWFLGDCSSFEFYHTSDRGTMLKSWKTRSIIGHRYSLEEIKKTFKTSEEIIGSFLPKVNPF